MTVFAGALAFYLLAAGCNVAGTTIAFARNVAHGDDTPSLLAAARALGESGGIVQLDCSRRYRIATDLDLTRTPGVILRGCLAVPDDPGSFAGYKGSLDTLGGIARASGATIRVGRDSGLENMIVRQVDLPLHPQDLSAVAGTAIATPGGGAGSAAVLENVLVVGAETCLDDSAGGDRLHVDGFYCDGTNGEIIGPSFDTSTITNVHNWPFATAGAEPKLRTGIGLTVRGASDDTVFGTIFDFGHKIGFLFDSNLHGNFHVEHLWADNNAEACVRIAGGRGINIASLTAYTCGIAIDVTKGAEVQITQAFLVSMAQECVRLDGTLSFALLHLEMCRGGGIRIASPSSVLSIGFLQVLNLAGPWTIDAPPGFTSDRIGIAKLFTDGPAGGSLYRGEGPLDPAVDAAPTIDLPQSADAIRLDGRGVVRTLHGGWSGRMLTVTTASRTAAIAPGGNVILMHGIAFGGQTGAVLALRYDGVTRQWRETTRSAP